MPGALQPLQGHCINLHGDCILRHNILHKPLGTLHSRRGTAYTFRDTEGGTATPASTLIPADVEMQAPCNHCRITASTACSQLLHSWTQQHTLQALADHCIHLHGHSIMRHNILHAPCGTMYPLHEHFIHIPLQCRDIATTAVTLHTAEVVLQVHCNH